MGLFRLAIIGAFGVALLPSDSEQQEMLYNRAALAAQWTLTFCERNATTCTQGAEFWGQFKKKAQFAGGFVYDMAVEQAGLATATAGGARSVPASQIRTGTLKSSDLEPSWRGGAPQKPAAPAMGAAAAASGGTPAAKALEKSTGRAGAAARLIAQP
ncbi:MAG: hypothetical protein ABL907_02740 [Hyphomicrobium sp.]